MGTLRFAHPTLLEGIAVRECPSAKELFDQWLRCFGVGDRKPNGSSYPRLRWRVDGVICSRQLSAEEVPLVKDRCDRSSLLCAIDRYLMNSNQ
jgi:hypothetical protein